VTSLSDHLALGTVQLGLPYGIANRTGQPAESGAHAILSAAWNLGVRCFDTAQAYGTSEAVLGRFLKRQGVCAQARVITKLAPDLDLSSEKTITSAVEQSLARLGVERLWGLLLHREQQLDSWAGTLSRALRALRSDGRVLHLGMSVYEPAAMERGMDMEEMTVFQLPANVFDRRFARRGLLARAVSGSRHLFVRSIFLQGMVFLEPQDASPVVGAAEACRLYSAFCREHAVPRDRFAVAYIRHLAPAGVLVIGAETQEQVASNCALVQDHAVPPDWFEAWDRAYPAEAPPFVNPSTWVKT